MAFSQEQQAVELITRAKRILVIAKKDVSVDGIASALALLSYLKKLNKETDAVIPGFDARTSPKFLTGTNTLRSEIGAVRSFEITLNVTKTPMREITYDVRDAKLIVNVVPEHGEWSPADVTLKHGADRYDLIIALDAPDLASLGEIFQNHADFLYRTPIINIDRNPGNEHWGQLNIVDLTAVSSSEILFGLFERWNKNLIDEQIATALLAGMIAKTQSFRTQNVTPKTLSTASQLIAMGAKREEIVHGLWRTRTVPTLKLWGKALSRLEQDRDLGLVWSTLTRGDFIDAGAGDTALDGIVNELMSYAPEAKVVVLVYETEASHTTGACVAIHTSAPYSAQELGRPFGAQGNHDKIQFCLTPGQHLVEGTQMVIDRLRETIKATKL